MTYAKIKPKKCLQVKSRKYSRAKSKKCSQDKSNKRSQAKKNNIPNSSQENVSNSNKKKILNEANQIVKRSAKVTKQTRTFYSILQKLEVVNYAVQYGRNMAAVNFILDAAFYPEAEKCLYTWIIEQRKQPLAELLEKFYKHIAQLKSQKFFELGNILNMDETPVWFDMAGNFTVNLKGEKTVHIHTMGKGGTRNTAAENLCRAQIEKLPNKMIVESFKICKISDNSNESNSDLKVIDLCNIDNESNSELEVIDLCNTDNKQYEFYIAPLIGILFEVKYAVRSDIWSQSYMNIW
ncbi:31627_t:CDS:2 [Gigaspora margarita]|uniref:31627_t:CDS:1 n=1 Tax=Gigaspora margarita TaxID=4874 RepID=A0ABN7VVQ4_GIGMA|nr:31627_t:CDS:2 [Gigaspora margarita]